MALIAMRIASDYSVECQQGQSLVGLFSSLLNDQQDQDLDGLFNSLLNDQQDQDGRGWPIKHYVE